MVECRINLIQNLRRISMKILDLGPTQSISEIKKLIEEEFDLFPTRKFYLVLDNGWVLSNHSKIGDFIHENECNQISIIPAICD